MILVTLSHCQVCSSLDHYYQNTRDFVHQTLTDMLFCQNSKIITQKGLKVYTSGKLLRFAFQN